MVEILEKVGPTNFFRTSGSEKVGGANFFHQFLDFQEVCRKMEILEKVGPTNFFQNFHFPANLLEIKELVEKVGPTNFF